MNTWHCLGGVAAALVPKLWSLVWLFTWLTTNLLIAIHLHSFLFPLNSFQFSLHFIDHPHQHISFTNSMGSFVKHMVLCHANTGSSGSTVTARHSTTTNYFYPAAPPTCIAGFSSSSSDEKPNRRSAIASTLATTSLVLLGVGHRSPLAIAETWGTRSYIKEKYFQPDISPEDAVARIRQTADGIRDMRHMLDTMAWRYVLHYVRLKMAYLSSDLKNAMTVLPESRRSTYVKTANELVENMSELDHYIRTPKVYESYVYYEKTLKSLDDIVALLA